MSVVRRDTGRRWATVLAATALLGATPVLLNARPVGAAGLSASQVVRAALRSAEVPHQGLAEIDAELGLPALPVVSEETALLGATTRVRTWWAAPTAWRVDTLTGTGEDITFAVHDSELDGVRQWSFENNTITDVLFDPSTRLPRADDLVPPQVTRRVLGWIGPKDRIEALSARRVAGIAAAGARIVPGDPQSLVGHVDLWVEPSSGLPLQLDVYAAGGTRPVFSSRFLDVELRRPPADVLTPSLVTTAQHESTSTPDLIARISALGSLRLPDRIGDLARVKTTGASVGIANYGHGFARLIVIPLPDRFMDRIFDSVSTTGRTLNFARGHATVLASPLLGLAVVSVNGQGYVVAGTLRPAALDKDVLALVAAG
jgi:hypothetical protein